MNTKVIILSAIVGLTLPKSMAANLNECNHVVKQLEMMNLAQKSLLDSMLKKNVMLADTLDHYADDFEGRQRIKKSDIVSLRNSAHSFRRHESREMDLVQRFQVQSDNLIKRANTCLDEGIKTSELRQSHDMRVR